MVNGLGMRSISHMLPQRAVVRRAAPVSDGQGGWTDAFAIVASSVPCRVRGGSLPIGTVVAGQIVSTPSQLVYFEPLVDVRVGDRIRVAGRTLLVQSAETQAEGVYRKALTKEEQPAGV